MSREVNMTTPQAAVNQEQTVRAFNGWLVLTLAVAALIGDVVLLVTASDSAKLPFVLALPLIVLIFPGFFSLQPNQARVLVLFGAYKGTVRESGFHWGNPFYSNGSRSLAAQLTAGQNKKTETDRPGGPRTLGRNKISLRARTLNGDRLKVNDKRGNPIEIAAV